MICHSIRYQGVYDLSVAKVFLKFWGVSCSCVGVQLSAMDDPHGQHYLSPCEVCGVRPSSLIPPAHPRHSL